MKHTHMTSGLQNKDVIDNNWVVYTRAIDGASQSIAQCKSSLLYPRGCSFNYACNSQSTEEAGAHHLCGIPTPHPMHNLAGSSDVLEDHLMAHTAPVSVRIKANILGLDGPRKPYG